LFSLSPLFLEGTGQPFPLKHTLKEQGQGIFVVTVGGVTSRNQAEALKGVCLMVDRQTLAPLEGDMFYHQDLVGLDVVSPLVAQNSASSEGRPARERVTRGVVKSVQNFGAGDLLEICLPGETSDSWLIPFKAPWVIEVCPKVGSKIGSEAGPGEGGYITVDVALCGENGFWTSEGGTPS
jgi:16S rRNA processing protein RimM